ncbi:unnamed protein product [Adineta ricciae]|uniref:Uncharacterized protein n=1 Tax=Adineta ricciae TaxID=249248 RepID=A0A815BB89_ADIRI|nr:unnamed protein product [Adineta ricciae]CAF1335315.1 unnamed protein product [Adineta ricciae]
MICASSVDLLCGDFGIIIRFATEYFAGNNSTLINRGVCKTRSYLLVCLPSMAATCALLSTFNQCVSKSQSSRWRRLSSTWVAKRLFLISMFFILTSGIFYLIIFDVYNGLCVASSSSDTPITAVYANVFSFIVPQDGFMICADVTWTHIR